MRWSGCGGLTAGAKCGREATATDFSARGADGWVHLTRRTAEHQQTHRGAALGAHAAPREQRLEQHAVHHVPDGHTQLPPELCHGR